MGLVSGFSTNVCNMVLSNELDPYQCLKKVLDGERYRRVEVIIHGALHPAAGHPADNFTVSGIQPLAEGDLERLNA